MPNPIIATTDETEFVFDVATLQDASAQRWAHVEFAPTTGQLAAASSGRFVIAHEAGSANFLAVEVLLGGQGLDLDTRDPQLAAAFIAWITTLPGFPESGVILGEWADEFLPLYPNETERDLLAALA